MAIVAAAADLVLVEVGVVLLGLLLVLVVLTRRVRARSASAGRVVPLGAQHALHVVELEGRRLLIGTGPAGAPRLLCELERRATEAASSRPDPGGPVAERPAGGWRYGA